MIDFGWFEWSLMAAVSIVAVFSAMVVFRSWALSIRKERSLQEDENRQIEYCTWREAILAHGGIRPVFCPIPLGEGEKCYSFDNSVSLYVPSEPHEQAGEGVLFDTQPGEPVGGGWSLLDNFSDVQFMGRGRLCVTDRCISFGDVGARREVPIDAVHTVAASRSCLLVGSDGFDRPLLFLNVNGQRLRDVLHFLIEGV